MPNIGNGRVLRVCDLCGGVDDHPRHVIAGQQPGTFTAATGEVLRKVLAATAGLPTDEQDRLLSDLLDTTSSDRHLDCCAADTCPDGLCGRSTAGADGKTGKKMLEHVMHADPFAGDPSVVRGVAA
jgi:hypothetical protein